MATKFKSFSKFLLIIEILTLALLLFSAEARPLRSATTIFELQSRPLYWLSFGAVKVGQKFVDFETLVGIKDSGPSPGNGHKYTDAKTLGGVKNSGPSPGVGHKYTNTETLGGIKDSGPSPGDGHKYVNSQTLGGIKDSGPSPGDGNNARPNSPGIGH